MGSQNETKSSSAAPGTPGGGRLMRLALLGLLLIGAAAVVRYCVVPAPYSSAVAEAVANASPDVADLLLEADEVARQMTERYPNSADTLDVTAMLHARFGDVDKAVECWNRCLEIAPTHAGAHFQMGLIAHERGNNAEASAHFQRATELDDSSSNYPVHWARSLTNEGQLEQAVEVLRADLARHPASVASLTILGDTCLQLKQHEQAKHCYEQVIRLAPRLTSAYYGLGTACSNLGEADAAKQHFARFKELKARDEQAHRDELKTEELGLERVQESVAEVLAVAAKGFLSENDPQTGERLLIRACELDPALGESWRVLTWLYERQGRIDEAVETAQSYVNQEPQNAVARVNLGQLLARVGRTDDAEAVLHAAVESAPNDAEAHARLAEFYLQTKRDPSKATAAAERATELAPTAHHFFLLALAKHAGGEVAAAQAAIERAIALAPDRSEYHDLRNAIRGGRRAE